MRNHSQHPWVFLTAAMIAVMCAAPAWSETLPSIAPSSSNILRAAGQQIQFYITGQDALVGEDLRIQINNGTYGPLITGVDILSGTIFAGNNQGAEGGIFTSTNPLYSQYNGRLAIISTATQTGTVLDTGLLVTLTLDASTVALNTAFQIHLINTIDGPSDLLPLDSPLILSPVNYPNTLFSVAAAPQRQWISATGGTWAQDGKWSLFAPYTTGDQATFLSAISANAQITLDGNRKVGSLTFNNTAHSYTLAQGTGGTLTLDNGLNTPSINNAGGSHIINVPLSLTANTTITSSANSSLLISGAITGNFNLQFAGPGTTTLSHYAGTGPLILNAGQLAFAQTSTPNSHTVITPSLTLAGTPDAWTATADIGNNALIIQAPAGDGNAAQAQARTIANQIAAGLDLANPEGILFGGTGITSATAANYFNTTGNPLYAVGWLQNNTLGLTVGDGTSNTTAADGAEPLYPDYGLIASDNPSVGLNDVLVKYTYWGDADLNGIIDDTDVALLVNGYQLGLSGWVNGDFDYNGIVDDTDVALLINAYQFQQGPLTGGFIVLSGGGGVNTPTPIPEPTSLLLLSLGTLLLLRRRR